MSDFSLQDWKKAFSKQVCYRMKAMELSAEDLAARSGLPLEYILRLMAGEIHPTHKARSLLGPALGCSLEFVKPRKA